MLGKQIKILREAKQISQVELARQIDVTKQSVSNWENDNIMPSVEIIKKLSLYFGCTSDYLLELDTERMIIETTKLTPTQTAHILQIIRDYESLNEQLAALSYTPKPMACIPQIPDPMAQIPQTIPQVPDPVAQVPQTTA